MKCRSLFVLFIVTLSFAVALNGRASHRHSQSAKSHTETFDFLLTGGQVVDGTGIEPRRADIGILGERIAFVGHAAAAHVRAKQTISAAGLIVAPGFIDPHTHADAYLGSPRASQ